jgi:methylmalonyl-CoA mutase N-terminal domain/subunit
MESLTSEMENRIVAEMRRVDQEMGGIVKGISDGAVQREVSHQAYLYEKGVQDGTIVKVGVNKYRMEEDERDVQLHPYNTEAAEEQMARLAQVKAERDGEAVSQALDALRRAAEDEKENVMPYVIDAVKAYATLGEMTDVFREVFGEFKEPVGL